MSVFSEFRSRARKIFSQKKSYDFFTTRKNFQENSGIVKKYFGRYSGKQKIFRKFFKREKKFGLIAGIGISCNKNLEEKCYPKCRVPVFLSAFKSTGQVPSSLSQAWIAIPKEVLQSYRPKTQSTGDRVKQEGPNRPVLQPLIPHRQAIGFSNPDTGASPAGSFSPGP